MTDCSGHSTDFRLSALFLFVWYIQIKKPAIRSGKKNNLPTRNIMSDSQFEVTPAAIERINIFFEGRRIKPIRIHMNDGFCVSSGLSLSVEEPEDGEVEFEIENYTFYINPEILDTVAPIKIDFTTTGFKIHSAIDKNATCPGCGEEGAWCSK